MRIDTTDRLSDIGEHVVPVELSRAIRGNWSAFSSCSERWSPAIPALGQCVVTACVLQDHLGGTLLRIPGHFYNSIGGEVVDLTRSQFDATQVLGEPEMVGRDYILANPMRSMLYQRFSAVVDMTLSRG